MVRTSQREPVNTAANRVDTLSVYLHGVFFLTGVGVLMLGPLLPLFSQQWHLQDSQVGMLLTAQFAGSFSGAVLLRQDLRKSLTLGSISFACGFTALALAASSASGFVPGFCSLLLGGFGTGQLINSISLIAARRSGERRGKALMSLNLIWSAGALLAPLLIGIAHGRLSLRAMLLAFSALAVLAMLWQLAIASRLPAGPSQEVPSDTLTRSAFTQRGGLLLFYFAALFFLHGALENSITGWIATFSVRYAHTSVSAGAYSTTMLWVGITAGRFLALLALRHCKERSVQLAGVAATIAISLLLHTAGSPGYLMFLALALGASLSPFIPVTSSIFLGEVRSTPRAAGAVMASAALGGAFLPLLIGVVSQHYGSLRFALELPPLGGAALLGLCLLRTSKRRTTAKPIR